MLNYLQFLIKSTNQHGVHSPFVFQYITKGLYSKKRFIKNLPKNMKWVLQSLQYFQPDKVYCNSNEIKQLLKHEELQFVDNIQDAQIGVINYNRKEEEINIHEKIKQLTSDQLLLIALNKYNKSFIDALRANESIVLVIDFYYGVLISKRKEQQKQNFYIRF